MTDLRKIDAFVHANVMNPSISPSAAGLIPAYSSSIAAAWGVVEKVADCSFCIDRYAIGTIWSCRIKAESGYGYAESDSAPLAICLAALRAKGVEIPE